MVILMPTLRSGFVIAGAYADKLRRTMFAQLRNEIKEKKIKSSDVAFHVAQLNKVLYRLFVDELKIDKGDVVRITIDYELTDEGIEWKFDTLKVEVFRRIPQEEVDAAVKKVIGQATEIMSAAVEYVAEKLGETEDGDQIFVLKLGDRVVGAFEILAIDNDFAYIKKGAAIEPSPIIIEKIKLQLDGKSIEEVIKDSIEVFTREAKYVEREEAEHLINYIMSRIEKASSEEEETEE